MMWVLGHQSESETSLGLTEQERHCHLFVGKAGCGRWAICQNRKHLWGSKFFWLCACSAIKEILEHNGPFIKFVIGLESCSLAVPSRSATGLPARMMRDVDAHLPLRASSYQPMSPSSQPHCLTRSVCHTLLKPLQLALLMVAVVVTSLVATLTTLQSLDLLVLGGSSGITSLPLPLPLPLLTLPAVCCLTQMSLLTIQSLTLPGPAFFPSLTLASASWTLFLSRSFFQSSWPHWPPSARCFHLISGLR
jgi:hypothetical protein